MKKLLCLILLCLLCGCTVQNQPSPTTSPAVSEFPTPTVSPAETTTPTPEPTVTPEDKTIASASTKILDKNAARTKNLRLAADAVDGTVIKPNEIFSFNDTVGPRTEAKGYQEAPVLVGTEHKNGIGGGVCQVSTTIFNAAEKAELDIVERHAHQLRVAYAKDGSDATVNYGTMDMRFKNTKSYNIVLRASVTKSKVSVTLEREQ